MKYRGACHCGSVTFEAEGELEQVIKCNCSYCSRKGTLLWFVPRVQFAVQTGADHLTSYRFNTHRIEHRFCPTCGCQPFAFGKDPAGNDIAAINARCLEDVDIGVLKRHLYDGRSA